jgi:ATP-dependent DNA ligase
VASSQYIHFIKNSLLWRYRRERALHAWQAIANRHGMTVVSRSSRLMPLFRWIEPQLCKLATKAPSGPQWAHEIKLDGYRMAARIEGR